MLDLLELELIIVTTKVVLALGPGPNRQEQKVLLTPKSSLQPPTDFLKDLCYYSILICVCVQGKQVHMCACLQRSKEYTGSSGSAKTTSRHEQHPTRVRGGKLQYSATTASALKCCTISLALTIQIDTCVYVR